MMKFEVKSGQEKGPSGLPPVEFFGSHKVLQIFMVCPDVKGVLSPFKVVSPLFQSPDDGQHLLVMDFIVPFYCTETSGEKCNRMPFFILSNLRQDCPSCIV